jgi:hypothetical protein
MKAFYSYVGGNENAREVFFIFCGRGVGKALYI